MAGQIRTLVTEIEERLKSIAEFQKGKAFHVVSEEDLIDETRVLTYPAVGVVYEGLRPAGGNENGLSTRAGFAIVVLTSDKWPTGVDAKGTSLDLLDLIRSKFRDGRPSTGHKWKFEFEGPARSKNAKVLIWVQRWSTPVQLTQGL